MQHMESLARKLENRPPKKQSKDGFWEQVKGVAKDLYSAGKQVAKDLGISLGDITALAAVL